jgi:predicted enzyme related to lactoylglutathione lyase
VRIRSVLARRLVPIDQLDTAVYAYERLFDQPARLRFEYPEKSLRLAQVGQLLIIGGSDTSLEPFRDTAMTFLVDDIDAYATHLPSVGATIVRPIQHVPSGRNMLVRQPDGALIEYVEHDHPNPADDALAAR